MNNNKKILGYSVCFWLSLSTTAVATDLPYNPQARQWADPRFLASEITRVAGLLGIDPGDQAKPLNSLTTQQQINYMAALQIVMLCEERSKTAPDVNVALHHCEEDMIRAPAAR